MVKLIEKNLYAALEILKEVIIKIRPDQAKVRLQGIIDYLVYAYKYKEIINVFEILLSSDATEYFVVSILEHLCSELSDVTLAKKHHRISFAIEMASNFLASRNPKLTIQVLNKLEDDYSKKILATLLREAPIKYEDKADEKGEAKESKYYKIDKMVPVGVRLFPKANNPPYLRREADIILNLIKEGKADVLVKIMIYSERSELRKKILTAASGTLHAELIKLLQEKHPVVFAKLPACLKESVKLKTEAIAGLEEHTFQPHESQYLLQFS